MKEMLPNLMLEILCLIPCVRPSPASLVPFSAVKHKIYCTCYYHKMKKITLRH